MKRLSIIIVTYHSEKDIYDCLASVWRFCDIPKEELEVIIVDNSPISEPMFSRLQDLYGNDIQLIHNTHNGGYGQGNNVGIQQANAPTILVMNPDVRLSEPVFLHATSQFENNPRLVLYGFTQRQANGRIGRSFSCVSTLHPYLAEPLRFFAGKLNLFFPKYMYVTGACFFMRKESIIKAGLFDEQIFMYGEEEDIHNRLLALPQAEMGYDRGHSYLHLHEEKNDFSDKNHTWMERYLESLFITNEREGIPREKTIKWAIKRNNISIWKETLIYFLTAGRNLSRLTYYREWKKQLHSKLNT